MVLKYAGGWNKLVLFNLAQVVKTFCEIMLSYKIGEWAQNEMLQKENYN